MIGTVEDSLGECPLIEYDLLGGIAPEFRDMHDHEQVNHPAVKQELSGMTRAQYWYCVSLVSGFFLFGAVGSYFESKHKPEAPPLPEQYAAHITP